MKLARDPALGSVALLALTALVVLLQSPGIVLFAPASRDVPYSSKGNGSVAVELAGDTGRNGVYFVPKGTPLAGFLDAAGVRADASVCCPGPFAKATTVSVLPSPSPQTIRSAPVGLSFRCLPSRVPSGPK